MTRRRKQSGSMLVEIALVSLLFFGLIFGIVTIGYLIFTYNSLGFMAQQGARWASVHGNTSGQPATQASVKTFVLTQATGLATVGVATNWNPDENPGSLVTVTVTYTAAPLSTYTHLSSLALTSSASATIRR